MGFVKKIKEKVGDYFNPDNEKAYNKFSESEKKEMLESLKMVDSTDLYWLDFSDLWESTVESSRWDTVNFREWVVKKDSIWNYVIVNWMKCREYQPWISWFVYQDIRSRYHPKEWLNVWFCEKWVFKKSIIINEKFWPKTIDIVPDKTSEELGWPFIEISDMKKSRMWKFHNITIHDIYASNDEERKDNSKFKLKNQVKKDNEWNHSLDIKWMKFNEYQPWISWLAYKFFDYNYSHNNWIILGEFKDWKMAWEWTIITPYTKYDVMCKKNNKQH